MKSITVRRLAAGAAFVTLMNLAACRTMQEDIIRLKPEVIESNYKQEISLPQPVPILVYHDISETTKERFRLPVEEFERQLKYLKDKGYSTITLSSLLKGNIPNKAVILTFDDLSMHFYDRVYPLLKKYGMKATGFVIVNDVLDAGQYKTRITWQKLEEMENSGIVDIESHTMNHKNLVKCTTEELKKELGMSKEILEAKLNKKVVFIAWPYGEYNKQVRKIARKEGYRGFVYFGCDPSITEKRTVNLSRIKRMEVDGKSSIRNFENLLNRFKNKTHKRNK